MPEVTSFPKPARDSLAPVPPLRRRPLRRTEALVRVALARSGRPLPAESAKRKAERPARRAVIAATHERSGEVCELAEYVPQVACWGPLDCDEIVSRGVNPGGHLDADNTQSVCRGHHDWRTTHPKDAEALGFRLPGSSVPLRKAVAS